MAEHATGQVDAAPRPDDGQAGDGSPPARRPFPPLHLGLLAVALLAAVGVVVWIWLSRPGPGAALNDIRVSGLPTSVSTSTANLMSLSPIQPVEAPGFQLVDQANRPVSLASLRGRVVVLEFMDPHCTDICPIVSKEFVDASRQLGRLNSKVVFLAINVNRYHASTTAMAAFSRAHGLDAIPSWHFVTGSYAALRRSWHDYGISVEAPNPNADIIHTSVVYFIDRSGHERYLATPEVDHTRSGTAYLPAPQVSQWATGIDEVVRSLVG